MVAAWESVVASVAVSAAAAWQSAAVASMAADGASVVALGGALVVARDGTLDVRDGLLPVAQDGVWSAAQDGVLAGLSLVGVQGGVPLDGVGASRSQPASLGVLTLTPMTTATACPGMAIAG